MKYTKNVSSKVSKIMGRIVMVVLIVVHLYALIMGIHMAFLHVISIFILAGAYYMMTYRVKHIIVKEQIAESLLEFSRLVLKVNSQEELYEEILKEVVKHVEGGNKGSLITMSGEGKLNFESVVGYTLDDVRQINLRLEDTFLYKANDGDIKKSSLVNDIISFNKGSVSGASIEAMEKSGLSDVKATISSPILIDDQFFGMINVDSLSQKGFTETDIELVDYFALEVSKIISLYRIFENTLKSAKYDYLTNALSRGHFMNLLDEISGPSANDKEFSIVYFDLDLLKVVNDQYGHDFGDQYIKKLVDGIQKHLNGEEVISRFGGDEFVALLFRSEKEIIAFHETCIKWFEENTLSQGNQQVRVQYSSGASNYPRDTRELTDLITIADKRMYEQKLKRREARD